MSDIDNRARDSRRIIRFTKGLASRNVDAFDHTTSLPRDPDVKQLADLTPGARYSRAFSLLTPQAIDALVLRARSLDVNYRPPNFHSYFFVDTSPGEGWEEHDKVLGSSDFRSLIGRVRPLSRGRPPATPTVHALWWPRGPHFLQAPFGTNAELAWSHPGGDGEGLRLADVEMVLPISHPQLPMDRITTFGDSGEVNADERDHATAVLGILLGTFGESGVIGAVPNLEEALVFSNFVDGRVNTAAVVLLAASKLQRGDVLLIEHQHEDESSGRGVPAEFEEAVFHAVRLATALGIVVVEAGGNGNEVDDPVGFDEFVLDDGSKFDRSAESRDSLAIIVSAAEFDPVSQLYKRCGWAPYGSRVDCHARGKGVLTCRSFVESADANGNPPDDVAISNSIESTFGGTSAAAAIIAATALQIQGIVKSARDKPLWPEQLREVLRTSKWGNAPVPEQGRPIGTMPNMLEILGAFSRSEFPASPPDRPEQPGGP